MNIEVRRKDDILIFDLEGEFTLLYTQIFKDTVAEHVAQGDYKIIINFRKVSYIDSSGIGSMISCFSNIKRCNGSFVFINIHGVVKTVFETAKLLTFFQSYDDEDDAIKNLST